jgi:hypothetical protein
MNGKTIAKITVNVNNIIIEKKTGQINKEGASVDLNECGRC